MSQLNSLTRPMAFDFRQVSRSVAGIKSSIDGYEQQKALLKLSRKRFEKEIRETKLLMKAASGEEFAVLARYRRGLVRELNRLTQFAGELPKHLRGSKKAFERRHAEMIAMYDQAEALGIDLPKLVADLKLEEAAAKLERNAGKLVSE